MYYTKTKIRIERNEHKKIKSHKKWLNVNVYGVSGGIRTPDRQLRRLLLYPAELLKRIRHHIIAHFYIIVKTKHC